MNQPTHPYLVSTIIPVYNRPELVRRAVSSVLDQIHRPIEILLVNDGSTDHTPEVLAELQAAHPAEIRVIHQANGGAGLARENGRQAARGSFIQYLDSDDYLLPNKFRDQIAVLAAHPECAIAYGTSSHVHADGRVLEPDQRRHQENNHDYGNPYYIKIDLEGYDSCVLSQLFEAKIFPDYLSAEAHTTLPFALIDESGAYNSYQIMDARKFSAMSFACPGQSDVDIASGCFHEGTSGPFGGDIPSPWMNSRQCLTNLAIAGLGWRDIHARKQHPDPDARVYLENFPLRSLAGALARKLVPDSWLKPKFFM